MALTSIRNEPCRVKKQMQEMTGLGRYMNNVPGPGKDVCFFEDPHIRLQKWGANLRTNTINLESDLMGLTRSLNQDCKKLNNYKNHEVFSKPVTYGMCDPYVEQSRTIMPAWTVLDMEQNNWDYLHENPQNHYAIQFSNNANSRNAFRDCYKQQTKINTGTPR